MCSRRWRTLRELITGWICLPPFHSPLLSRIQRCIERAPEGENLTRNELLRMIRQIDKQRTQYHQMYSDLKWGAKEAYHLCINTSGKEIKQLIPALAQYARAWFGEEV